jgi:hypothetical protein
MGGEREREREREGRKEEERKKEREEEERASFLNIQGAPTNNTFLLAIMSWLQVGFIEV